MSPDVLLECPRTSFRDVLRVNVTERVWIFPLHKGGGLDISSFNEVLDPQSKDFLAFRLKGGGDCLCPNPQSRKVDFWGKNEMPRIASNPVWLVRSGWMGQLPNCFRIIQLKGSYQGLFINDVIGEYLRFSIRTTHVYMGDLKWNLPKMMTSLMNSPYVQ